VITYISGYVVNMPCDNCQKKLTKLATPDVREGNRRAVGVNKLIEKKSQKDKLLSAGSKCQTCRSAIHMKGKYCPSCSHREGRCWMCGKKIFNTKEHCMSLV